MSKAVITVNTDEDNGTLFWVITNSATPPTKTQVFDGKNNEGTAAAASGNLSINSTGAKYIIVPDLSPSTTYYVHFMHQDTGNNRSDVISSNSFVTLASTNAAVNVDGGLDYYSRFNHSLPSNSSYFPIGVWFEEVVSQDQVDLDKDAGLNLYVQLTASSNLTIIENNNMKVLLQANEWGNSAVANASTAVAGWVLFDEIDMTEGPSTGYDSLLEIIVNLPADGRMRYNNYGKGVIFWETEAEAQRFVNEFQHATSADIYWFTDPDTESFAQGGRFLLGQDADLTYDQRARAYNYGLVVDKMRALDIYDNSSRKPIWGFVEVGWPFDKTAEEGGRNIAPDEIGAAVWHCIIAEARGIVYFNHSFGGPTISAHCLRDAPWAAHRAVVKSTNELIANLAPILNSNTVTNVVTSSSANVRTMSKFYDSKYYIFSGNKINEQTNTTFTLSNFVGGNAVLLNESRTITISNSQFSDTFANGTVIHIYRIDGDNIQNQETRNLLAAFQTQPSEARITAMDELISALKTAGVWQKADRMGMLAAHDRQAMLVDWIDPSITYTDNVTLDFETDVGLVPTVDDVLTVAASLESLTNYSLDSASMFAAISEHTDVSGHNAVMGAAGGYKSCVVPNVAGSNPFVYGSNRDFEADVATPVVGTRYTVGWSRTASDLTRLYYNGVQFGGDRTAASSAMESGAVLVCGTSTETCRSRVAWFIFASGLTSTEVADMHAAVATYMATLGLDL